MYVSIYVCVLCMTTCVYACILAYVCVSVACMFTYMCFICLQMHVSACVSVVCLYVCVWYIYVCIYVYIIYVCMYVCICLCECGIYVYVCCGRCLMWYMLIFLVRMTVMYTHGGLLSHSPSYSLETKILIESGSRPIARPRALPISAASSSVLELQMHAWPCLTSYLGVESSCKSLCQNVKHFCPLSHLFRHVHALYNNPGW